ncbi:flagellar motor control protein ZomB [Corynebacterium pyruviciproducens]|uniref:flagellar motor control protein ZomB n=1 Tax=Corynebacterium pyruviciproducens TaxID=598660 RepID=UPI0023F4EF3E|nr:flagellar motor control protein ZomB [Corynebacterium pyruviciproducens]MDK6566571.1 flagellar motor control protein ZomB [Corynebacterium pyruviciproducens]MDK7214493.1 flagellar motor control protein ZomB [Corynebacterium pyruviciproducens]
MVSRTSSPRHIVSESSTIRRVFPAQVEALVLVAALGVCTGIWGWMRRWMSDDGLIVLRTVRNLLAGHGPVFNAGERVEANTSTLWQYLIYGVSLLSDARLEIIALWLALGLSVAAVAVSTWATARLNWGSYVLPVGALVYIALPPARDFFTSGLEWGLSIFWIAVAWLLLVRWSGVTTNTVTYVLAFWAGLSWLVRPELALYGGFIGILLLAACRSWKRAGLILLAALPVPAGYEIFRMGYYGLLVPHTAVAKSASDAMWGQGWKYVSDLTSPYNLWLVLAFVVAGGLLAVWRRPGHFALRSRTMVIVLMLACGIIHVVYVMRVGGDFMHGRMLLLPLFAMLQPVWVLPVRHVIEAIIPIAVAVWATIVSINGYHWYYNNDPTTLDIVDERAFWLRITHHSAEDPMLVATDFLKADRMSGYQEALDEAFRQPTGMLMPILKNPDPEEFGWITVPRMVRESAPAYTHQMDTIPITVYYTNMGMTSMNAPLNVRVLDPIGLSTPIAARGPRIEGERIGHDKYLPEYWQLADSASDVHRLPFFASPEKVPAARDALFTPDFVDLYATYRAPLTSQRFIANMKWALKNGRTLEISHDLDDYAGQPVQTGETIVWPIRWGDDSHPQTFLTWPM